MSGIFSVMSLEISVLGALWSAAWTRYDVPLETAFTCKYHLPGKGGLLQVFQEQDTLNPGSFSDGSSAGLTSVAVSSSWLGHNLISTEMCEKAILVTI